MYKEFIRYVENLDKENSLFLLACSGGVDSSCLAHLFYRSPFKFALAHVNYKLRGEDSDKDALFVQNLAKQYQVKCYLKEVDLGIELSNKKSNLQEAARTIRYDFFTSLSKKTDQSIILVTAHHRDDRMETSMINMLRGTGLQHLSGFGNEAIARPLLKKNRLEIIEYLNKNQLTYREDASNQSTKYLRNFLRNDIIPKLEVKYPNTKKGWSISLDNLERSAKLLDQLVSNKIAEIRNSSSAGYPVIYRIDKIAERSKLELLYHHFSSFGFHYDQIKQLLSSQTGAKMFANKYSLAIDRNELILDQLHSHNSFLSYSISTDTESIDFQKDTILQLSYINEVTQFEKGKLYLAKHKLVYPLRLRKWKDGDKFKAYGLKSKSIKVKDYLTNKKVSKHRKDRTYILESDGEIISIIGMEIAYPYRVTKQTKDILVLSLKDIRQ